MKRQISQENLSYIYFFIPITFDNPIKVCFKVRNKLFQLKHARHKIKSIMFLYKKIILPGFLKIIGVQNQLPIQFDAPN